MPKPTAYCRNHTDHLMTQEATSVNKSIINDNDRCSKLTCSEFGCLEDVVFFYGKFTCRIVTNLYLNDNRYIKLYFVYKRFPVHRPSDYSNYVFVLLFVFVAKMK